MSARERGRKRKKRYLEKLELLQKEREFIKTHEMRNEAAKRALLYSLQVSVEISMDLIAMKIKDLGLTVSGDYENIEKLLAEGVIIAEEADIMRKYNGVRNAVVHRYNKINFEIIERALKNIDQLLEIVLRVVEA